MPAAQIPVVVAVGLATAGSTMIGGALALRFRSLLRALFGFSSGAIIGVALLDLMPEAITLGIRSGPALGVMTGMAFGFVGYLALDRLTASLFGPLARHRGHLAPASLSIHSLMDGLGVGLAFHISSAAGIVVAVGVLAHDLLDGANTVSFSLAGGVGIPAARRWLAINALAPITGIGIASLLSVPDQILSTLLAIFAGGFLYIGANELLPRMRESGDALRQVGATSMGLIVVLLLMWWLSYPGG